MATTDSKANWEKFAEAPRENEKVREMFSGQQQYVQVTDHLSLAQEMSVGGIYVPGSSSVELCSPQTSYHSLCVAQAGLELTALLLPQPPKVLELKAW